MAFPPPPPTQAHSAPTYPAPSEGVVQWSTEPQRSYTWELDLRSGDMITAIREVGDSEWLEGECNGIVGRFRRHRITELGALHSAAAGGDPAAQVELGLRLTGSDHATAVTVYVRQEVQSEEPLLRADTGKRGIHKPEPGFVQRRRIG